VLVRIKRNWERYAAQSWIEAAKRRLHHNVLAYRAFRPAKPFLAPWRDVLEDARSVRRPIARLGSSRPCVA